MISHLSDVVSALWTWQYVNKKEKQSHSFLSNMAAATPLQLSAENNEFREQKVMVSLWEKQMRGPNISYGPRA